MIKRTFDILLSAAGLFIFLPLVILFSYAILLEDGPPVFYLQERVGKDTKIFRTIKFRTLGYRKQAPRFSNLLRTTALDELPQLFNILKGEMSFVGPRPLISQEVATCNELDLRCQVRPGLTGMAQVFAFKDAPILEKFNYDLWYIKNQNIGLDVWLILKSFWISFRKRWDISGKSNKI